MALTIPPELKKISAYIRRAEELDKDIGTPESRLVAYYCRQYAVHTGIPLASSSAAAKDCLGALLGILEKEKPAMDSFTREEAKFLCKSFADRVFAKADEEDRLGGGNKATAKAFYAAATFLQILDQFMEEGDPDMDEIKNQVVYSKWKSTEILKAIRDGRTPTPGGYQEHRKEEEKDDREDAALEPTLPAIPKGETVNDNHVDFVIPTASYSPSDVPMEPVAVTKEELEDEGTESELEKLLSYPVQSTSGLSPNLPSFAAPPSWPSPPPPDLPTQLPPLQPQAKSAPSTSGRSFGFEKKIIKNGKASRAQLDDAIELTRFALAAFEDKDVNLASTRLHQALQALGN